MSPSVFFCLFCLLIFRTGLCAEDDLYSFDVDSYTKKIWEWKGELKLTAAQRIFNEDSVFYKQKFKQESTEDPQDYSLELNLESRWDWNWSRLYLAGEISTTESTQEDADDDDAYLREGYWELALFLPDSLQIGKRLLRWGKGYAYNPVAFLERPKNAEDPEANREGTWLSQWIWIIGKRGGLKNSSLTLVYAPVRSAVNDDFLVENPDAEYEPHRDDDDILGIKAYGLVLTTDLDLYYVASLRNNTMRWGFDFASNLTANLEIHGEYAETKPENQNVERQFLLGLRYLTVTDVTCILEWYNHSEGMTEEASRTLYRIPMNPKTMQALQQNREINKNYGFLQASFKEPFDLLYFTPSIIWIRNLDDGSNSLQGKLNYAPWENWIFEFNWQHFDGPKNTQYGENMVRHKFEVHVTMAF